MEIGYGDTSSADTQADNLADLDFEPDASALEDMQLAADPSTLPDDKPATRTRARQADDSPRNASSRPPSLDEWVKFFNNVVLKSAASWYIDYAFRGIDEDMLSEREVDRIALSDDERKMIAVPFAELSNKSKIMRKHGRVIVSSGDAIQATIVLGAWARRVNRIAAKYRKQPVKVNDMRVNGSNHNGSSGQGSPQATQQATGTNGGFFPPWYSGPVYPGSG